MSQTPLDAMFTIPAATPSPPRPHRDSLLMSAAADEDQPATSVHQLLRPPTAVATLLNVVEQSEGRNGSSLSPQRHSRARSASLSIQRPLVTLDHRAGVMF